MRMKERFFGSARMDTMQVDTVVAVLPPQPLDERRVVVDVHALPLGRVAEEFPKPIFDFVEELEHLCYAGIQPRALRGAGTAVYASGIAERKLSNILVATPLPGELRTLCGGVFFTSEDCLFTNLRKKHEKSVFHLTAE
ncbi:MAG: hypothetical protein A2762_02550 [Candidatus Lloydbacteria bacterium RIFCSPHIGHO2_01_FULL_54_11]|nr:MAG: hypothetical protein A2762_02550 [Candidatus Lloydbacteria bacterium RIFCSPHIGHO2_01_FULL_54_11]OGZ16301.1 MAG: hypothetical protein A3H76_04695 [Candidatus Lloydbacteria bacterium RIFCSPLOWO2_02_FULL_54_12]